MFRQDSAAKSQSLPRPLTPLVGRREELAEIVRILGDPACWLLTLVGPGGIGKTRLAIEVAAAGAKGFAHGVCFVDLEAVHSADMIVSATADALRFPLSGPGAPHSQLFSHLGDREMLLVLDGFEHLLAGAGMLADLFQAAPKVKLLVTSREALSLQEEWLYPLDGLPYPLADEDSELMSYGAVQLFVERTRRVRPGFSLDDDAGGVVRLCQLVEGMPLALELAASWTKTLDPTAIWAEIQRGTDFLATSLRNVPERHRSMQAVFDQTWELLAEGERDVLKRLAVFRGGFRRRAAKQVAGASLSTLTALVDKSLLRWDPGGRYQIHGLLRQYAAEQLAQSSEDVERAVDAHCAYYAEYLHERFGDLLGGRQQEALIELESELRNVRAAWHWAVGQKKVDEIQRAVQALSLFYQFQSRYLEGAAALEQAAQSVSSVEATELADLVLVAVLVDQGWFHIRFGQLEEAEAVLARCQALYRRLGIPPLPGQGTDPLLPLGIIASIRGDYAQVARLGEDARLESQAHDHPWNRQFAYYLLAIAALAQGQYESARQHAQQAYDTTKETGDGWFMAYCLNELGNVAYAQGDYGAAKAHYEASYTIRQGFDDPEGMAVALNHLGEIALQQQAYIEAQRLYRQSLALYRDIDDRGGLASALNGLGSAAVPLGDYRTAGQQFHQALQIAAEIQFAPLVLSLLLGIAELLIQVGQEERGAELLTVVVHHPSGEQETRKRAQQTLHHFQASPPASRDDVAAQEVQDRDLSAISQSLLAELTALDAQLAAMPPATEQAQPSPSQPLVEPLTARELEVLGLIAAGLSNQQIADELVISIGTAKWYASQIYSKLSVSSRTEAVARARGLHLLS